MVLKKFTQWFKKKEQLHKNKQRPNFNVQDIWSCAIGVNIGFEQDGTGDNSLRPVIILKKFNNEVCWILPLTRTVKKSKYYYPFKIRGQEEVSTVILSQIRLMDVKRLGYRIGTVPDGDFIEIKKHLRKFLS